MHLNIFRKISVKKTSFCPNRENGRGPEFGYRWHWPLRPNWAADIGALRKPRSLTSIRNDGKREWRAEMRQCLSVSVHTSERLETWHRKLKIRPRSLFTSWVEKLTRKMCSLSKKSCAILFLALKTYRWLKPHTRSAVETDVGQLIERKSVDSY